jgi:hypothetical protein
VQLVYTEISPGHIWTTFVINKDVAAIVFIASFLCCLSFISVRNFT